MTQTVALDDYIVKFEIWDTAGNKHATSCTVIPLPRLFRVSECLTIIQSSLVLLPQKISRRTKSGQERYRSLAPMYYRGAAAALVVYDITAHESFQGAKTWIEELQRQGSADIVIARTSCIWLCLRAILHFIIMVQRVTFQKNYVFFSPSFLRIGWQQNGFREQTRGFKRRSSDLRPRQRLHFL